MANPERGEVALVIGGREYTLKPSMNIAVTLESKLGKRMGQIMAEAGALNFASLRALVWLLLQKYHADEFKTEEQVGDFIDESGGVAKFLVALNDLGTVNEPPAAPPEAGRAANPRRARTGTGGASSKTRGASV